MSDEIFILHPGAEWEGCLTAVCRGEARLERLTQIDKAQQLAKYRVRATLSDVVHLRGDLRELLKLRGFSAIRLNEDPLQIYLHQGGWNAVYYTLVSDGSAERYLAYIEVVVEAKYPRMALRYARTAFNRLLDSEAVAWLLPAVVARLDLLELNSDDILVSEIVLPYTAAISLGPLGGLHQSPLFSPWLATLREAITASSPYWRLLCAWRVYDGIEFLRGQVKKQASVLNVNAPMPKDPPVDLDQLKAAGLPEEFLVGIKKTSDLFRKLNKMRDGVAHFLLKEGTHTYFSDGGLYSDYSVASTVLVRAAMSAIRDLGQYYQQHIEVKTSIGSILPERRHADKFFVRDPQLSTPLSDASFRTP